VAGVSEPHGFLADLLDQSVEFVRRFVVFGAIEADAVALWNAHTYVYDFAPATPYLHPHSPEPSSGKTTLLDVLSTTARHAIQADNLTEAVLFRLIDKERPTLLFDEVDAVFGKTHSDSTEGIRQVLNSGYRKGKQAYRCIPPAHNVVGFDVYCPKATAGLNELPGTLASRSIPIALKPPRPEDSYEDFDPEEVVDQAEVLRINLQSWADTAEDVLRDPRLKPAKLPGLDARGNQIWRILFRIADQAGGEWPERARLSALELSGGSRRHDDASATVKLLGHIRDLFDDERIACRTLVEELNADEAMPYGGWNDGKGITTRELGKKLSRYGIHAKTLRVGEYRGNGYERDQFEDAWSRYLPPEHPGSSNRDTVTTRIVEPNLSEGNRDKPADVTVSETGANPVVPTVVTVVTVSEPESRFCDTCTDFERCAATHRCAELDRLAAEWAEEASAT
jgi:Protein of unknown function (DUF3631)